MHRRGLPLILHVQKWRTRHLGGRDREGFVGIRPRIVTLQYLIYAAVVNRWGVYPALKMGGLLSVLIVMAIPLLVPLNAPSTMAAVRIFRMIFQSCITIATNTTVPVTQRATMNGLSMLGGSVSKGLGPAFAGWLVSFSLSSGVVDPTMWGSTLIFGCIGGLGVAISDTHSPLAPLESWQLSSQLVF